MKYTPHPYQQFATEHILANPCCGLFLDMGLGKTVATLTAIDRLRNELFEVSRVLVIAPLRVAEMTWTDERDKWGHLRHLRIARVLGSERQRKEALRTPADVYIINRENVAWLVAQTGTKWPFDMVVVDESSSFKNHKSQRFRAIKQVLPAVARVVILAGTPAPNGLLDVWPQVYMLDQGKRLGVSFTAYREKYFSPDKRNGTTVFSYKLNGQQDDGLLGAGIVEAEIYDKLSDICVSMKTTDYLDLPPVVSTAVPVHLPGEAMAGYLEFEREQVLQLLETDGEITAVNAAALSNKLLQYAGGAVYDASKVTHVVHEAKLDALEERIEAAQGKPVLVAYWFKHERDRILTRLKNYKPRELKTAQDFADWNARKIPVALGHPASMGHGLNLQAGGNRIVWFGPIWSLELYQQMNKRIDRSGQLETFVFIDHLVAAGTIDEDVMGAVDRKAVGQNALMDAVKARINKYLKIPATP